MEAMVHARRGRILAAPASDPLGREVEGGVRAARGRPGRGRRAGAGVGAVAGGDGRARSGRRHEPRHRRADRGGDRQRRARGARHGRRQRDQRRRPRRAGGARRPLHDAQRGPRRAAQAAARSAAQRCLRRAEPDAGYGGCGARLRSPEGRVAASGRGDRAATDATGPRWRGRTTGRDPAAEPMAGAGGGLAGGLWAFAGATLRPGAALVLDAVGFDALAHDAFAVVTGEGRLDEQTIGGKLAVRGRDARRQGGVPCYAVVGQDDLDAFEHRLMNIEVEAAARNGSGRIGRARSSSAARRVARRLLALALGQRAHDRLVEAGHHRLLGDRHVRRGRRPPPAPGPCRARSTPG